MRKLMEAVKPLLESEENHHEPSGKSADDWSKILINELKHRGLRPNYRGVDTAKEIVDEWIEDAHGDLSYSSLAYAIGHVEDYFRRIPGYDLSSPLVKLLVDTQEKLSNLRG